MRQTRHLVVVLLLLPLTWKFGCSSKQSDAIANIEQMNTFELMTAAAHAAGRIEDAGLLFFAGQARFQIDKQVYPPVGNGGNSPGILKAALGSAVGESLDPARADEKRWAKRFSKAVTPAKIAAIRKEIIAERQQETRSKESPAAK